MTEEEKKLILEKILPNLVMTLGKKIIEEDRLDKEFIETISKKIGDSK